MAPPDRPNYDQSLKLLLTRAHDGFLALVAPDLIWQAERSPELPATSRQADFVWEVTGRDIQQGLLHLELQTKVEADLGERLTEYAIRLWRRYHLPVRSVVVLLRETRQAPVSPFALDWGAVAVLRYHFEIVRLWEQPQELVLDQAEPVLWPLATLMAGATIATTMLVAERLARSPLPRMERSELTGLLAALAGLRLPRAMVTQALRRDPMIREILDESSVAELWREEGREAGRQEGREAGRQEGREAGRQETVRLVLESRFGPLDETVLNALQQADGLTLQSLVAHLATDTLEQVYERLGLGH